jgi:hypothetical protein
MTKLHKIIKKNRNRQQTCSSDQVLKQHLKDKLKKLRFIKHYSKNMRYLSLFSNNKLPEEAKAHPKIVLSNHKKPPHSPLIDFARLALIIDETYHNPIHQILIICILYYVLNFEYFTIFLGENSILLTSLTYQMHTFWNNDVNLLTLDIDFLGSLTRSVFSCPILLMCRRKSLILAHKFELLFEIHSPCYKEVHPVLPLFCRQLNYFYNNAFTWNYLSRW